MQQKLMNVRVRCVAADSIYALYSVMSKYGSKAALERLQDFKAKKDKAVEDYTRKYFSF